MHKSTDSNQRCHLLYLFKYFRCSAFWHLFCPSHLLQTPRRVSYTPLFPESFLHNNRLDECFNRQTTKEHRKSSKRQLQKNQTGPNDTTQQFIAYNTVLEEKEEFVTIFRLWEILDQSQRNWWEVRKMTLSAYIAANCIVVTKATKSRTGAQNAKSGVIKNF